MRGGDGAARCCRQAARRAGLGADRRRPRPRSLCRSPGRSRAAIPRATSRKPNAMLEASAGTTIFKLKIGKRERAPTTLRTSPRSSRPRRAAAACGSTSIRDWDEAQADHRHAAARGRRLRPGRAAGRARRRIAAMARLSAQPRHPADGRRGAARSAAMPSRSRQARAARVFAVKIAQSGGLHAGA